MFEPSPEIGTRNDFGKLLNYRNLTGTAVEVGVDRGEFAANVLEAWRGAKYVLVDPWSNPPGYQDRIAFRSDRESDFIAAQGSLSSHSERTVWLRMVSAEAVRQFADGSLDFVYLDADHMRLAEDISLWWPKVKPGGILAGHDLNGEWEPYVRTDVEAFLRNVRLRGYYILDDAASWYVTKGV